MLGMDITELRYEWRVWGTDLGDVAARLDQLARPGATIDRIGMYYLSRRARDINPKVRLGVIDIKVLREVTRGFERWEPAVKQAFPLGAWFLRNELFPLWRVETPDLEVERYTADDLVAHVIDPHPDLAAVEVTKHRQMYALEGCIAELTDVTIGERRLQTACVESADLDAAHRAHRELGLDSYRNVNYPLALQRVLGWIGEED